MTATVRVTSGALDDGGRREFIYSGDILIFKDVEPMREFCTFADSLIGEAFDPEDPLKAQFELEKDDYLCRVGSLQKEFRKHPEAKRLFLAALEHVGVELGGTFWDWLYLRVLPHGAGYANRRTSKLGFHRDTWSSNVYAQSNWWAPIYPITSESTVAFYPEYWQRTLKNNSAAWDLEEIRTGRSAASVVPEPEESVDSTSELRPIVEAGDLLCFSGAHLHASVPNTSGLTGFSVEVRTVNSEDIRAGHGAPNLDGEAPHIALNWFRHVADATPLPIIPT